MRYYQPTATASANTLNLTIIKNFVLNETTYVNCREVGDEPSVQYIPGHGNIVSLSAQLVTAYSAKILKEITCYDDDEVVRFKRTMKRRYQATKPS
jgi:hypothetical protein